MAEQAQNTKTTSTRKAGSTRSSGKSSAAKAPTKKSNKATSKSGVSRGGRSPAGKSQANAGVSERQGESSMAQAPMFGGTMNVAIEEVPMTTRGGRRQGPEPYPFGDLTNSRLEGGAIIGPSFFVPESDNPKKIIAAGRKRHKPHGKIFLTRQMEGPSRADPETKVPGVRVWLAPANYGQ